MNASRLRKIVILLLICINLVLGGNLIYTNYRQTVIAQQTIDDTIAFLDQCGIWMESDLIPRRIRTLPVLSAQRNPEQESDIAGILIGTKERIDQGGGISRYESEQGTAAFRRGGLVNLVINHQKMPETGSEAEKTARSLLKKAGILPESAGVVIEDGNDIVVRFVAERNGCRLQNAALEVAFRSDEVQISGCFLVNTAAATDQLMRRIPTLLADFGAYVVTYHLDISLIVSIETAYFHTVNDDGSAELLPVLMIRTDNGTFLLNGLDGTLLSNG